MRVVSLVPSWTETLIEAGVNVVGRTHFCVHPHPVVRNIPVVGGTKNWRWQKILELHPDLLVLDKEENPRFMGEQEEIPYVVSHIRSIADMPTSLRNLADAMENEKLGRFSDEWARFLERRPTPAWNGQSEIPGILEWGKKPSIPVTKIIYVIWRAPWMTVSRDTFLGSMLSQCGLGDFLTEYGQKYPIISLEEEPGKDSTLLLFSSEPYPFLRKKKGLANLGFPYAFVNGEHFSWFGVRSLRFLQALPDAAISVASGSPRRAGSSLR